jgi:hypothetical protein
VNHVNSFILSRVPKKPRFQEERKRKTIAALNVFVSPKDYKS